MTPRAPHPLEARCCDFVVPGVVPERPRFDDPFPGTSGIPRIARARPSRARCSVAGWRTVVGVVCKEYGVNVVSPVFRAGDAVFFDQLLLHCTGRCTARHDLRVLRDRGLALRRLHVPDAPGSPRAMTRDDAARPPSLDDA